MNIEIRTIGVNEVGGFTEVGTLLDVRLAADYAKGHIPGAKNNCVFEVQFLERMQEVAPDKSKPICVYGSDTSSLESRMAAEKLMRAGYTEMKEFRGGIREWFAAGMAIEGSGDAPQSKTKPVFDGSIPLDLTESRIEWTGRNLLNKHFGTVGIKSGHLDFGAGTLKGGEFVIDLSRLECTDLKGGDLHDVLIAHLHDHDFLDLEKFPEAKFHITDVQSYSGISPGLPNMHIGGELTLKDVTKRLEFDVVAGVSADGQPAAQAAFAFDRTMWNMLYGSGRLFSSLGGHLVNDLIEIELRIVGKV